MDTPSIFSLIIGLLFMTWPIWVAVIVILIVQHNKKNKLPPTNVQTETISNNATSDYLRVLATNSASKKERDSLEWTAQYVEYQVAANVPAPATVVKQPSHEDIEARNINTILYIASFLLVAAATLFIGTNLPGGAKAIGLILIALLFYVGGLGLHSQVARLRPAAIAFASTGLALLPFCGLAYNDYVLHDPALVWLGTSIVGLGAFIYASYQLRGKVFAYLSSVFVFSVVLAGVAELSLPFAWYALSLIGAAIIINVLVAYAPKAFGLLLEPISITTQAAAPLAIIIAIFALDRLSLFDYEVIFGLTAVQYGLAMLMPRRIQDVRDYFSLARIFTILTLALVAYDLGKHDILWSGVALAVSAVVTAIYALCRASKDDYEQAWLWVSQLMVFIALSMWWQYALLVIVGLVLLVALAAVAYKVVSAYIQLFSNVLVIIGITILAAALKINQDWQPVFIAAITGLAWYAAHLLLFSVKNQSLRSQLFLWSAVTALTLGFLATAWSDTTTLAGVGLGAALALAVATAGYLYRRFAYYEVAAIIVTIALQRLVGFSVAIDFVVYAYWWTALMGLLAYSRYRKQSSGDPLVTLWFVLALVSLSGGSGIKALSGDDSAFQLVFLFEHVVLLLVGAVHRSRFSQLIITWGAVGIILSLIWMLRGYTYALLGVLGLGLIALAVWRLTKLTKTPTSN